MVLKTKTLDVGTTKELKWTDDGGKKFAGMEVDANEEESENEEVPGRVNGGKDGEVVFRRRMLEREWTPRRGSIIRLTKERRRKSTG